MEEFIGDKTLNDHFGFFSRGFCHSSQPDQRNRIWKYLLLWAIKDFIMT